MRNPFRYFNSSPEVIRLTVMLYIRFCNRAADVNPSRSALRRDAGLVLLSVVGVRCPEPPHDAIRRSGRADLRRVVRQGSSRPLADVRLHPIRASPRRDLVAETVMG